MLQSAPNNYMPPSRGVLLAMITKAKVYPKGNRFRVNLWWKGKPYERSHYDSNIGLVHKEMANQIAGAINADIRKKGMGFDPRQWFKTSGYEFQFNLYCNNWLKENEGRYAPAVRGDVRRYTRYFIEYFQTMDIREIRKMDIKAFLKTVPQHLAPKTQKNILILLHKIFTDVKDDEMIEKIPGFPKIIVPEPEIKWIERKWQDKIINAIPEQDRPIFIFIRTWGVRPGEARALMWDCIDFDHEIKDEKDHVIGKGLITIRRTFSGSGSNYLMGYTKSKHIRFLPFTSELREVFKRLRGISGFVFRNKFGRPYLADISRTWREARDKVGAKKVTLYQGTRHSFATQHLGQLDLVSQVLGHTSTVTTRKRYQGVNVGKIRGMK